MWIEAVGWLGSALVLIGYIFNSRAQYNLAIYTWLVGDATWITYDILRNIYPHLFLSSIIIIINLYAIYNIIKNKK